MNKQELPLPLKLAAAGSSACFADFVTFPLDTAKVRLQVSIYKENYFQNVMVPDISFL